MYLCISDCGDVTLQLNCVIKMKNRLFIVDAFTDKPFGGNTAGVVLLEPDSQFPGDELMQHVAAELRYSETAFVVPTGDNCFSLRYFTPEGEVDLCGHATIATFGVLCQEGMVAKGSVCRCRTLAGDLTVKVGERVLMQMAEPRRVDVINSQTDVEQLCSIMGSYEPDFPIEIISTGLPDIIFPVATLDELNRLAPDMDALREFSRKWGVVGVHAFVLSRGLDDGSTAHVRNFAPLYGVNEESATGTANAALTHYLLIHGFVGRPSECKYVQGEVMNHPSVVTTVIDVGGEISVGGSSRIVARGELLV